MSQRDNYLLMPIGLGSEYLRTVSLELNMPTTIGRNDKTFLSSAASCKYFTYVSRNHVSIKRTEAGVFLQIPKGVNSVAIDGVIITSTDVDIALKEDSVIDILHKLKYFHFKLERKPNAFSLKKNILLETKDAEVKKSTQGSAVVPPPSTRVKELSGIAECAICLTVIASAQSAIPCGHTFCFSCLSDWIGSSAAKGNSVCPSCQGEVSDTAPNCLLDNMIEAIFMSCDEECRDASSSELVDWRERLQAGIALRRSAPIVIRTSHPVQQPPPALLPPAGVVPSSSRRHGRRVPTGSRGPGGGAGEITVIDMFSAAVARREGAEGGGPGHKKRPRQNVSGNEGGGCGSQKKSNLGGRIMGFGGVNREMEVVDITSNGVGRAKTQSHSCVDLTADSQN